MLRLDSAVYHARHSYAAGLVRRPLIHTSGEGFMPTPKAKAVRLDEPEFASPSLASASLPTVIQEHC